MKTPLVEIFLDTAHFCKAKMQQQPRPLNRYFAYQADGEESVVTLLSRNLSTQEEADLYLSEKYISGLSAQDVTRLKKRHPTSIECDYADVITAFNGNDALQEFDQSVEITKQKIKQDQLDEMQKLDL